MDNLSNNKKSQRDLQNLQTPKFENTPTLFKGMRIDVHQIELKGQNGKVLRREVVVHPGAVLILPIVDRDHILMIRNQRFAVNQELWELPAGTLEPGEPPIETAKRELIEETGYRAKIFIPMTTFYTSPGFCNEVMYCFVASDLELVGQDLDETEQITVEIVPWKKALAMTREGTIIDGKTLAALLYYHTFKSLSAGTSL